MRPWLIITGGMLVWAVHFLALYVLASIFGSTMVARLGVGSFTILGIAADGALLVACWQQIRNPASNSLGRWTGSLGIMTAELSLVAVAWQGLPALLG